MFSQHRLKLIFVLFEQRRFLSVDCISTYLQANPKLASKGSSGVYMVWQAVCLTEESLKSLWLNSSVKYTLSTEKQLLNVIDVLITFYRYFTFSTYPHFIIVCMKSVALIMGVASIINSIHSVSCKDHFRYIRNGFHWLGRS